MDSLFGELNSFDEELQKLSQPFHTSVLFWKYHRIEWNNLIEWNKFKYFRIEIDSKVSRSIISFNQYVDRMDIFRILNMVNWIDFKYSKHFSSVPNVYLSKQHCNIGRSTDVLIKWNCLFSAVGLNWWNKPTLNRFKIASHFENSAEIPIELNIIKENCI